MALDFLSTAFSIFYISHLTFSLRGHTVLRGRRTMTVWGCPPPPLRPSRASSTAVVSGHDSRRGNRETIRRVGLQWWAVAVGRVGAPKNAHILLLIYFQKGIWSLIYFCLILSDGCYYSLGDVVSGSNERTSWAGRRELAGKRARRVLSSVDRWATAAAAVVRDVSVASVRNGRINCDKDN